MLIAAKNRPVEANVIVLDVSEPRMSARERAAASDAVLRRLQLAFSNADEKLGTGGPTRASDSYANQLENQAERIGVAVLGDASGIGDFEDRPDKEADADECPGLRDLFGIAVPLPARIDVLLQSAAFGGLNRAEDRPYDERRPMRMDADVLDGINFGVEMHQHHARFFDEQVESNPKNNDLASLHRRLRRTVTVVSNFEVDLPGTEADFDGLLGMGTTTLREEATVNDVAYLHGVLVTAMASKVDRIELVVLDLPPWARGPVEGEGGGEPPAPFEVPPDAAAMKDKFIRMLQRACNSAYAMRPDGNAADRRVELVVRRCPDPPSVAMALHRTYVTPGSWTKEPILIAGGPDNGGMLLPAMVMKVADRSELPKTVRGKLQGLDPHVPKGPSVHERGFLTRVKRGAAGEEEVDIEVDPKDAIFAAKFGRELVPLSDLGAEKGSDLNYHPPPRMDLVGFVSDDHPLELKGIDDFSYTVRHLDDFHLHGPTYILVPSVDPGEALVSARGLSALARSMNAAGRKAAILRCVRQANSQITMYALLPVTPADPEVPDHFLMRRLPFAEDLRRAPPRANPTFPEMWQLEEAPEDMVQFVRRFDLGGPSGPSTSEADGPNPAAPEPRPDYLNMSRVPDLAVPRLLRMQHAAWKGLPGPFTGDPVKDLHADSSMGFIFSDLPRHLVESDPVLASSMANLVAGSVYSVAPPEGAGGKGGKKRGREELQDEEYEKDGREEGV